MADDPENREKWFALAEKKGFRSKLEAYVDCAEQCGFSVNYAKTRSIFLTFNSRSPVISVWPAKSSPDKGIWFGLSVTNLGNVNAALSTAHMPADFEWQEVLQGNNTWFFGHFGIDQVEATLRMVASRLAT